MEYIKTALGSPTPAEHAAVIAERDSLKKQLAEAQKRIEELESQALLCTLTFVTRSLEGMLYVAATRRSISRHGSYLVGGVTALELGNALLKICMSEN
ncbi:flagellar associated protein 174, partial [Haematococcus lacustris]